STASRWSGRRRRRRVLRTGSRTGSATTSIVCTGPDSDGTSGAARTSSGRGASGGRAQRLDVPPGGPSAGLVGALVEVEQHRPPVRRRSHRVVGQDGQRAVTRVLPFGLRRQERLGSE